LEAVKSPIKSIKGQHFGATAAKLSEMKYFLRLQQFNYIGEETVLICVVF